MGVLTDENISDEFYKLSTILYAYKKLYNANNPSFTYDDNLTELIEYSDDAYINPATSNYLNIDNGVFYNFAYYDTAGDDDYLLYNFQVSDGSILESDDYNPYHDRTRKYGIMGFKLKYLLKNSDDNTIIELPIGLPNITYPIQIEESYNGEDWIWTIHIDSSVIPSSDYCNVYVDYWRYWDSDSGVYHKFYFHKHHGTFNYDIQPTYQTYPGLWIAPIQTVNPKLNKTQYVYGVDTSIIIDFSQTKLPYGNLSHIQTTFGKFDINDNKAEIPLDNFPIGTFTLDLGVYSDICFANFEPVIYTMYLSSANNEYNLGNKVIEICKIEIIAPDGSIIGDLNDIQNQMVSEGYTIENWKIE